MKKAKIKEFKGFYMFINGRDIFYGTDKKNKTEALALEILKNVFNIENEKAKSCAKSLLFRVSPAICIIYDTTLETGMFAGKSGLSIDFKGNNFSAGYIFTDEDALVPNVFYNGKKINLDLI